MKAWSDFTIIYNEHFFDKSDGAMAMRIDKVRHLFFQHLFPHRAERADNVVKICIACGRCVDRKTRQNTEVGFILIFIYLDFRLVVAVTSLMNL